MTDLNALTPIEHRVLAYLDQRGPSHRADVVCDLAGEKSKIAYRRNNSTTRRTFLNGSNGAAPLIMGKWCKRLIAAGYVKLVRSDNLYWAYKHHEITDAGRAALRSRAAMGDG